MPSRSNEICVDSMTCSGKASGAASHRVHVLGGLKTLVTTALAAMLIACGPSQSPSQQVSPEQQGAAVVLESTAAPTSSPLSKPNVVFILVDDLGWKDLGVYGSYFYETPNLDQLAAEGMRFTSAYASSPLCSPTRAAIMTGKHPARLRITNWIPGDDPQDRRMRGAANRHQLPLQEHTLAETMRQAGYKTFFAGKWHLGEEGFLPTDQGFDVNLGGGHMGQPPAGYYSPYNNPYLSDGPEGEYLPDRLTDEAVQFIEANRKQPFFLYLSYYTVHTPLQASKRHIDKFIEKRERQGEVTGPAQRKEHGGMTKLRQDNTNYASMIYAMDENVGRVLGKLDAMGLRENTIVIFTSDNGGRSTLYGPGDATSNLPLRAGKGWVYEGGIRVPLIVRVPGVTQPGSRSDTPVVSTDLYPTITDLAGLPANAHQHVDGLSLRGVLTSNEPLIREAVYFYYPHYHGSASVPSAAVREGDWKLVQFYESDTTELYNLKNDIGETQDLSARHPAKALALKAKLKQWRKDINAALPSMNEQYVEGAETMQFEGVPK